MTHRSLRGGLDLIAQVAVDSNRKPFSTNEEVVPCRVFYDRLRGWQWAAVGGREKIRQVIGASHKIWDMAKETAENLFGSTEKGHFNAAMPLALRMRPQMLEDFVGQDHFLGPASCWPGCSGPIG